MIDARWRPVLGYLLLIAAGGLFLWFGRGLTFGRVANIGPGFFPAMLAIGLILLAGFGATVEALRLRGGRALQDDDGGEWPLPVDWISLAAIPAAILSFALTVRPLGLMPAVILCFLIASLADGQSRWRLVVPLSLLAAVVCWLVFVVGLSLPLRPWRWPL